MTLDPSQDPDRFQPEEAVAPLDPAADPDRYASPTLPGLLGDGAHEDDHEIVVWLLGLAAVFAFLVIVSVLITIAPR